MFLYLTEDWNEQKIEFQLNLTSSLIKSSVNLCTKRDIEINCVLRLCFTNGKQCIVIEKLAGI